MNENMKIGAFALVMALAVMFAVPVADVSAEDPAPVVDTDGVCTINYLVANTVYTVDAESKDGKTILMTALPDGAKAPLGQTLKGWMLGGALVTEIATENAKTYTVNAVFTADVYDVTFAVDGEIIAKEYGYGDVVDVPKEPTAPEGKIFAGWSDGKIILKGSEIPAVVGNAVYSAVFVDVVPDPVPEEDKSVLGGFDGMSILIISIAIVLIIAIIVVFMYKNNLIPTKKGENKE